MGVDVHSTHIRARFDGHVFVPDRPLDLPEGTVLEGWTMRSSKVWPPGYLERTMGAWDGEDILEPDDPPPLPEEPFA